MNNTLGLHMANSGSILGKFINLQAYQELLLSKDPGLTWVTISVRPKQKKNKFITSTQKNFKNYLNGKYHIHTYIPHVNKLHKILALHETFVTYQKQTSTATWFFMFNFFFLTHCYYTVYLEGNQIIAAVD